MPSKYYQKIKQVVEGADLPKELSDDLKKELESHFYEKEHDLRFAGLKPKEIEKQLSEDFGNGELVAKHLNFVHKKSFYSFIKSLMKNENKPYIFETVFFFIIILFLYQNVLSDVSTQTQISSLNRDLNFFNKDTFLSSFLLIFINLILIIRLYRGGALSQKLVSTFLFFIMLGQFGYNYFSAENSVTVSQNQINKIDDQMLLENPEEFDDFNQGEWVNFSNEKEGYQLHLPLSYVAFRKDNTSDLVKYFTPPRPAFVPEPGEIVAFGPAFSDDRALINIKVFDADNSPDKKADETWGTYYLRTQLNGKKYILEPKNRGVGDFELNKTIFEGIKITLEEELGMRKNILILENNNRLFSFLYDDENPIHEEVLNNGMGIEVPAEKIQWVIYDNPSCPFTLSAPDYWGIYKDIQSEEFLPLEYVKDCEVQTLGEASRTIFGLQINLIHNMSLDSYLDSEKILVQAQGNTKWQDLPAKKLLLGGPLENRAGFAVQTNEKEWILFRYWIKNKQVEKILGSLVIKE